MRWFPPLFAAVVLLGGPPVQADCTGGGCIPGGGPEKSDCTAEFSGTGLLLNYPPYDPAKPKPKKELRCYDGDAGCDSDGALDGVCTFNVNVCLAATDPALPACTVSSVTKASVKAKGADAALLSQAVSALLPVAATTCTSEQTIAVALKPTKKGGLADGKATVKVSAVGDGGRDKDPLRLRCIRRDWPSHGFNHANHRASPYETAITPASVPSLELAWAFPIDEDTPDSGANGVTATPTMGHGFLFVPSWNGILYALDPKKGKVKWRYDGSIGLIGIQSSAAVTPDGRVLIVDSLNVVHCLDARSGRLLWKTPVGEDPNDHAWSSAQVANDRVFVGLSGLADSPPAPGRLVTLDLDTGAVLWQRRMVPDRVCRTDTATTCAVDGDCPDGGSCVKANGAGVTATVAVDATGETIYVNTVGSFTFPGVGDTDSIMRLDAATGDPVWIEQVTPDEQFGYCTGDSSIECSTDTMCDTLGPCVEKSFYHDFGFLNGPLLVTADDGTGTPRELVVSGSKDGSLYAFDPATGDQVWRNEILPVPVSPSFGGWGLFNGAVAFAEGRFFAALDGHAAPRPPVPPLHLMAFSAVDGATVWDDEIGNSWSHVNVAGGVLFAGPKDPEPTADPEVDVAVIHAYDTAGGTRLRTFELPAPSAGGVTIVDGMAYIPYGIFDNVGGVLAYRLP